jgi:hypothetical protein
MPGFDNDTVYCTNVDFRGVEPVVGQITTNGQLLIGSTVAPNIRVGTLASAGGTVVITPGAGTINLEASVSVPTTFAAEDASTATPALNILNIVGTATNGIGTTAAGNTVTIGMQSPLYDNFQFVNLGLATPRYVYITNTDANVASTSELRLSVPPLGADGMITWEIQGLGFYSVGVDNSDSDKWKLTNSSDPSSGNALISTTNAGVITLFNDLDVTEGGTGVSTLTSHGILMGNGAGDIQATAEPANGQILIGKTGDFPQLASIMPGPGISITSGAGSITVGAWGGGISWTAKGASDALVVNNGYFCNAGAALSFSLPALSTVGSVVALCLDGSTSWTITQAAGQQIRLGAVETTLGAGGSLASTAQGDTVHLLCVTADTRWVVIHSMGNITVV